MASRPGSSSRPPSRASSAAPVARPTSSTGKSSSSSGRAPSSGRSGTAPADGPSLLPQGKHKGQPAMALSRPFTLVGSRNRAHLHLVSSTVSKVHGAIVHDNGRVYVRDLASRTRVYVNGRIIREMELSDGDLMQFGSFTFKLSHPKQVASVPLPPPAQLDMTGSAESLQLDGRTTVIGRRQTCDLFIDDEAVSTVHAIIFELDGQRFIRDVGSRTGTFVNGTAVHQQPLNFGDRIRIGPAEYQYRQSNHAGTFDDMAELEDLVGTAPLLQEAGEAVTTLDMAGDADRLAPPTSSIPEPGIPLAPADDAAHEAIDLEADLAEGLSDTAQLAAIDPVPLAPPEISPLVSDYGVAPETPEPVDAGALPHTFGVDADDLGISANLVGLVPAAGPAAETLQAEPPLELAPVDELPAEPIDELPAEAAIEPPLELPTEAVLEPVEEIAPLAEPVVETLPEPEPLPVEAELPQQIETAADDLPPVTAEVSADELGLDFVEPAEQPAEAAPEPELLPAEADLGDANLSPAAEEPAVDLPGEDLILPPIEPAPTADAELDLTPFDPAPTPVESATPTVAMPTAPVTSDTPTLDMPLPTSSAAGAVVPAAAAVAAAGVAAASVASEAPAKKSFWGRLFGRGRSAAPAEPPAAAPPVAAPPAPAAQAAPAPIVPPAEEPVSLEALDELPPEALADNAVDEQPAAPEVASQGLSDQAIDDLLAEPTTTATPAVEIPAQGVTTIDPQLEVAAQAEPSSADFAPAPAEQPLQPTPTQSLDPLFGLGRDLGSFIGGMPLPLAGGGATPPKPAAAPAAAAAATGAGLPPVLPGGLGGGGISMPPPNLRPGPQANAPAPQRQPQQPPPQRPPAGNPRRPRMPFADAPVTFDTPITTLAEVVAVENEDVPMFGAPPPPKDVSASLPAAPAAAAAAAPAAPPPAEPAEELQTIDEVPAEPAQAEGDMLAAPPQEAPAMSFAPTAMPEPSFSFPVMPNLTGTGAMLPPPEIPVAASTIELAPEPEMLEAPAMDAVPEVQAPSAEADITLTSEADQHFGDAAPGVESLSPIDETPLELPPDALLPEPEAEVLPVEAPASEPAAPIVLPEIGAADVSVEADPSVDDFLADFDSPQAEPVPEPLATEPEVAGSSIEVPVSETAAVEPELFQLPESPAIGDLSSLSSVTPTENLAAIDVPADLSVTPAVGELPTQPVGEATFDLPADEAESVDDLDLDALFDESIADASTAAPAAEFSAEPVAESPVVAPLEQAPVEHLPDDLFDEPVEVLEQPAEQPSIDVPAAETPVDVAAEQNIFGDTAAIDAAVEVQDPVEPIDLFDESVVPPVEEAAPVEVLAHEPAVELPADLAEPVAMESFDPASTNLTAEVDSDAGTLPADLNTIESPVVTIDDAAGVASVDAPVAYIEAPLAAGEALEMPAIVESIDDPAAEPSLDDFAALAPETPLELPLAAPAVEPEVSIDGPVDSAVLETPVESAAPIAEPLSSEPLAVEPSVFESAIAEPVVDPIGESVLVPTPEPVVESIFKPSVGDTDEATAAPADVMPADIAEPQMEVIEPVFAESTIAEPAFVVEPQAVEPPVELAAPVETASAEAAAIAVETPSELPADVAIDVVTPAEQAIDVPVQPQAEEPAAFAPPVPDVSTESVVAVEAPPDAIEAVPVELTSDLSTPQVDASVEAPAYADASTEAVVEPVTESQPVDQVAAVEVTPIETLSIEGESTLPLEVPPVAVVEVSEVPFTQDLAIEQPAAWTEPQLAVEASPVEASPIEVAPVASEEVATLTDAPAGNLEVIPEVAPTEPQAVEFAPVEPSLEVPAESVPQEEIAAEQAATADAAPIVAAVEHEQPAELLPFESQTEVPVEVPIDVRPEPITEVPTEAAPETSETAAVPSSEEPAIWSTITPDSAVGTTWEVPAASAEASEEPPIEATVLPVEETIIEPAPEMMAEVTSDPVAKPAIEVSPVEVEAAAEPEASLVVAETQPEFPAAEIESTFGTSAEAEPVLDLSSEAELEGVPESAPAEAIEEVAAELPAESIIAEEPIAEPPAPEAPVETAVVPSLPAAGITTVVAGVAAAAVASTVGRQAADVTPSVKSKVAKASAAPSEDEPAPISDPLGGFAAPMGLASTGTADPFGAPMPAPAQEPAARPGAKKGVRPVARKAVPPPRPVAGGAAPLAKKLTPAAPRKAIALKKPGAAPASPAAESPTPAVVPASSKPLTPKPAASAVKAPAAVSAPKKAEPRKASTPGSSLSDQLLQATEPAVEIATGVPADPFTNTGGVAPSAEVAAAAAEAAKAPPGAVRKKVRLVLVLLAIIIAAAAVAAVWIVIRARSSASAGVRFQGLTSKTATGDTMRDYQLRQRMLLESPAVLAAARANLDSAGISPGLLGDDPAQAKRRAEMLAKAEWKQEIAGDPYLSLVLVAEPADLPAEQEKQRLMALLSAFSSISNAQPRLTRNTTETPTGKAISDLRESLQRQQNNLVAAQARSADAPLARTRAIAARNEANKAGEELGRVKVEVDAIKLELGRLEQRSRPTTSPTTRPDADFKDAQLTQILAEVAKASSDLAAVTTSRDTRVSKARLALENARKQFDEVMASVKEAAGGDAATAAYVAQVQGLAEQIRKLNDDLVQQQKDRRQQIEDQRRVLTTASVERIRRAWEADPQLKELASRRAVLERQFNAATAEERPEAEQYRLQLAALDRQINAQRDLIATRDEFDPAAKQMMKLLDDQQQQLEQDRRRMEANLAELAAAAAKARPDPQKLSADQQARAQRVEEANRTLEAARRAHDRAVEQATVQADAEIQQLSGQVAQLQARAESRRRELIDLETATPEQLEDRKRALAVAEGKANDLAKAFAASDASAKAMEDKAREADEAAQRVLVLTGSIAQTEKQIEDESRRLRDLENDPFAAVTLSSPTGQVTQGKDQRLAYSGLAAAAGVFMVLMALAVTRSPATPAIRAVRQQPARPVAIAPPVAVQAIDAISGQPVGNKSDVPTKPRGGRRPAA